MVKSSDVKFSDVKSSDVEMIDVKRQWRQKTATYKPVMLKSVTSKDSDGKIQWRKKTVILKSVTLKDSDVKRQWFWNQWW